MARAAYRETPATISLAVNLLWASFWLSIAGGVWSYYQSPAARIWQSQMLIAALFAFLVVGGICMFLFDKILAGRNWARILVTIGFGLNVLYAPGLISALINNPLQPASLSIVYLVLSGMALRFLYSSPGKNWFARQTVETAT